jgi:hypothetical protein
MGVDLEVRTSSCASERSAWEEAVSRVRVAAGRLRELIGGRLRLSAALSVAHRLSRPRRVSAPPRTRSPEALTRPCQVWKVDCSRPVLWCLRKTKMLLRKLRCYFVRARRELSIGTLFVGSTPRVLSLRFTARSPPPLTAARAVRVSALVVLASPIY